MVSRRQYSRHGRLEGVLEYNRHWADRPADLGCKVVMSDRYGRKVLLAPKVVNSDILFYCPMATDVEARAR